jgi:hypothetical protein
MLIKKESDHHTEEEECLDNEFSLY